MAGERKHGATIASFMQRIEECQSCRRASKRARERTGGEIPRPTAANARHHDALTADAERWRQRHASGTDSGARR
jgi:hypothetical protein